MKPRNRRSVYVRLATILIGAASGLTGCAPPMMRPVMRHDIAKMLPAVTFPGRAQLQEVESAQLPVPEPDDTVSVEHWTLEENDVGGDASAEPPPEQVPWQRAVQEAAAASKHHLKGWKPLDCVAELAGRFALANGGDPDVRLVRFMAARCGAYAPNVRVRTMVVNVPADLPNENIAQSWSTPFSKRLLSIASKAPVGSRIGVWFARDEHRAGIAVAMARLEATLGPVAISERGVAVLTGRIFAKKKVSKLVALVNQGAHGVATCTPDRDRTLPHFRVRCPLDPEDTDAWIEIIAAPERGLLQHPVARVLARRDALAPLEYQASAGPRAPVATAKAFRDVVVPALNRARTAAGVGPLTLVERQSETNTRIAAAFFDAESKDDTEKTDMIALGLLAGWDVPGVIRDASIITKAVPGTHDALGWLEDVLETPFGRRILLSRDTTALALGAAVGHGIGGVGVVATTYKFHDEDDCMKAKEHFVDTLRKRRAALGLSPLVLMNSAPLVDQANEIRDHLKHPQDALADAVYTITTKYGVRVTGFYVTGLSLDFEEVPAIFLGPRLELAVAVTYVKLPGAAWGQYVALLVMPYQEIDV